MVAGMLMPLRELRAIYEVLFRDGVMVAKKDKRPQAKHPEIEGVSNLQVIRAMGSLKSRGYVKETFAWRHFYWYLTNEGIVYLRDYLHLPPEIVPASLQRIRKPAATLAIAHRASRVQSVEGPTSYVPKPGRRGEAESQESLAERQGYRHKMMGPGEKESYSDRTPRFRGRPLAAEPVRPKASWEMEDQRQPLFRRGNNFRNESAMMEDGRVRRVSHQQPDVSSEKPVTASQERRVAEVQKEAPISAQTQRAALKQDVPQTTLTSVFSKAALPLSVAAVAEATGAATSKIAAEPSTAKINTEKLKIADEKASMKPKEVVTSNSAITMLHDTVVKEEKTKKVIVDPIKSAQVEAMAETVHDKVKPQAVITMAASQETSSLLNANATPVITKPVKKDIKEEKTIKVIMDPIQSAEIKATSEMVNDKEEPQGVMTKAAAPEMSSLFTDTYTFSPVITKPAKKDVKGEKTAKVIADPVKSAEVKATAETAPDNMMAQPLITKAAAQETSKLITDANTATPVITKPVSKDVKEEKAQPAITKAAAQETSTIITTTVTSTSIITIPVSKDVKEEKAKKVIVVDPVKSAETKATDETAPVNMTAQPVITKAATQETSTLIADTDTSIPVIAKPVSKVVKDEKAKKVIVDPVQTEAKAIAETALDNIKDDPVITKAAAQETSTLITATATTPVITKPVSKDVKEDKRKKVIVDPVKSADAKATSETANTVVKPQAAITMAADQETSSLLTDTDASTPDLAKPANKDVKKEKTKKMIVGLVKSAEVKATAETAPDNMTAQPVITKAAAQETSKLLTDTNTDTPVITKPVSKDIKEEKLKSAKVNEESIKPAEAKTPVESKTDDEKAKKTAKVTVTQETTKPPPDSTTREPVSSTNAEKEISKVKVTQVPTDAEVTSVNLSTKEPTVVTESSIFEVKTTISKTTLSTPTASSEDAKPVKGKATDTEKKDEKIVPDEALKASVQGPTLAQKESPQVSENVATTEVVTETKPVVEGSSKSKRKKKKSQGERSKSVEELPESKMEKDKPCVDMPPKEVAEKTLQPTSVTTSEQQTVFTSIKTEGPVEEKKTQAKIDTDGGKIKKAPKQTKMEPVVEVSKQTKDQSISEVASRPQDQIPAVPPVVLKDDAQVKEKVEGSSVSKKTHGPLCSEDKLTAKSPHAEPVKSEELTVTKVETVTVQKITQVELIQASPKPEGKSPVPASESQKPTVETKSLISTGKAAEESSKGKKKGKGKKQAQAPPSDTINTKPVFLPEAEPSPNITSLPKATVKDSRVMTSEVTELNVSPKMTPERMCSEETKQAAAVLCEAPADKGEVEPALLFTEKIKREVPKPKTSSTAREAPAAGELASAAPAVTAQAAVAPAQASPLDKQEEPPRVAQHSASQAAERSTEKRLSVSAALKQEEEKKKDLEEDTPSATATPAAAQPDQLHLVDNCESGSSDTDEAAMRKKIVVVEEIVEVKQIISPDAGGQSPPPPVIPAEDEEELDLDVLEEIAIERALLAAAPGVRVQGASPEEDWDHSLEAPEEKQWPNFFEDERDRVQKKTFTKWVNKHLMKHRRPEAQRHVTDLYEDLRDGHNLISLLEVLSGETLPREKGRMRFHKLQNVQIALDFLRHRQVKLVNIRNDDIADGNPKLTLGLIWTIILHFQVSSSISDIQINGQSEDMTAKEKLLLWSQRMTDGYQNIRCDNFTTSWRDGKLFNAVIHKHYPRLIDMGKVYRQTNLENLEQAFGVAERDLGVTRLLDPEDVDVPHPDEKSIITYVSSLYDVMPRVDVHDGVRANELELRWQEYYELVTVLLQWIRHHVMIFEERKFPSSYEEIELLWRQFLKFKETELPVKETDKNRSKHIYQSFESAVHAGQVKVPPGYHPIDVEKEWGKLHVAILERERLLRIEFERLERLQRIVTKVQMESGTCDDQLNHLETLLQKDIRLMNAGKPPQHTAEVERELDKADNVIRLLFNDVQVLKDGRHPQAEQMYRRVYRIHERLVNLRSDYNLRLKSSVITVQAPTQHTIVKARPEMDDVTLRYVKDLLAWVEENQLRIDEAEWGSDLPSVESQLGSHRGLHQTVEDFRSKIERAKADESQLSPVSKGAYKEYLGKLDLQYGKLLNSSKFRLRNLDSLHAFVSAATKELMWLNDKEEEEVNFDWSDRNTNMTAKKDNYSGLMRELELREKKVNDIQAMGDKLVRDGHPGKKTVEAFTAALQTQWSWILQLCCCIEAHLKENTAYYQFFGDVKEAQDKMKKIQENMKKKYSCDRTTTATRLEDLLQDAVEEKEQLNEYKTLVNGLNKRAKSIIQLKPRNPTTAIKGKLPIQAVCDFKQQEITVHKGDECALLNNSQPFKWKVLNHSGHEAIVPSVCFMVPPVNKEAVDSVSSLDAGHQQLVSIWQTLHIDMKSLLSWQYLMRDFTQIRSWNITMLKTMKPEEYRLLMRNLEIHYQDYIRDSQDSQLFGPDDRTQVEEDYTKSTQHFDNLLRSMEKGQQDETLCKNYISEIKDLRVRIEDCETGTVARIRKPMDKEPLKECVQKTTDQKKVQVKLEGLKKDLDKVSVKTQEVLASPQPSPSAPVLRSELDLTVEKMDHAYMLSSVYLEKLKTVEMVIRNTQGAEGVLKQYEDCLREVHTVPGDVKEVEAYRTTLKKMRAEAEGEQPVFDSLEEELKKATAVSNKMSRVHNERDVELDHYRQQLSNLQDRWKAVFTQIDIRQRELEQLGRQLGYYRDSYEWLMRWISDAKKRQEKIQAVPITDSKTLKEQLAQEKNLLEEIEGNKDKVDECQKYAKAYIDTIKDYELQLVAYKAHVDPLASPLKKSKLDSASDNIIQEYVTLRTRYSELMTLTSQYIKFITDTQHRLEDEEMADAQQKQIEKEKIALEQTFLTEKEMLLKKEKLIAEEKKKLESQYEKEVKKAQALKDEQERQRQQMEEEKKKLHATMDEALHKQKEAEQEMLNKQKELQDMERKRLEQERILAEENQKLREKLQQLEEAQKNVPDKETIRVTMVGSQSAVYNGQNAGDAADSVEKKPDPLSFDGIRERVPASRLHDVGLLSKKEFDQLKKGKITVQDLGETEALRRILKGKNGIAGVLTPSNEKMSIYQASKEKKITPGTAMILLEAQAASGYMLDPIKNQKLSVNEAVKEGVIGPELHNKMLLAERAVIGYKDPYTGGKISVFEAMKKGLIEHDHAIRILEAQLATGGIVDPINSHRVPNETAYKQGQYDAEMNKIMEKPSDDTKGYFDPSTQEPLTYAELMARCTTDPDTNLLLLPITDKAAQCSRIYTEEETKDVFSKTTVSVPFGRFQGKTVTIWEIINSEYFTEDQKKDLLRQYKTGKITIEKIIKIVITVAEDKEKKNEITFDGLRSPVPATELLESKIIDKDLYNKLHKGNKTVKEVSEMEPVHKALKGTNCIAGVVIDSSKETMSFYQAMKKDMMRAEPALHMLEAQAGTGYVVDPVNNQKHTVDEAVKAGVVGPELHEKLLSAERAVTGYKDPYTGKTVSLFQAMKKDLIPKEQGIRLLDAQMATGGIIDPVKSHHIPHDVACKRNYFDDEMKEILNNPTDETKCFYDPNTKENVTYSELFKRCVPDKKTGLPLLPLSDEAISAKEEPTYTDAQTKEAMTQATVELDSGPFKGRKMTIWDIINSEYLTEEQRFDLLRQFRSGKVTIEKIIKIVITIVDEKEAKKREQSNFKGLRAPVPASSLYDSKIIDKPTFDLLQQGKTTPKQVSENPNVNKYLQGSDSIAGIYLEPTKEKVSIYQAMKKKLLRHNTGLSLLEAQAATGFLVDPVRNQCLTVDEAVKSGLVGPELHEKLLSAEKAVTGYKDPFTGNKISLFEAVQKDLILKEHAMPLIEAQMVSGGIIDPVNSHRVPTDAAYQKNIFSKEMAKTLSEPSDDNKAFSDPETDENATYRQLKDKCHRDPETGLYILPLSKPQSPTVVEKTYLYTEEQTQSDLASTQIDIPIEGLADKPVNLWEIMNSNLLPEQERQKLMDDYRSGKITKERMIIIIIEIMEQREIIRNDSPLSYKTIRRRITIEELYNARIIDLETYNLLKQGKRDIRDIMEMTNVKQYLYGTGCVAGVATDSSSKLSIYQAMKRGFIKPELALSLLEAQAATGFIVDPHKNETLTVDEAVRKEVVGPEIHDKLLSAERAVTGYKDPYSGKIISLFQAMKKDLVPEDYALKMLEAQTATGGIIDPEFQFHLPADIAMQRGYINKETNEKLTYSVKGFTDPVTDEDVSYAELLKRCKLDGGLRLLSLGDKRLMFKGLRKQITMEELLRSQIIDQETVTKLNEGSISVEEVTDKLSRYLEGTSCIAGVFLESTKERLSIYQAMKKNMIRPGTAFELLEAQAATGYVIDPIKNLKLTVSEAVKMGIVGPEFKDKLLSAERAVTGYRDPYTGKTISLFQAMKKGLILKDHGIRLLEAQIATGGIIDPEESHRLPVEVAYKRGFFDEEMNEILTDPSDDTKGFFDPNTEENLTYLQLMERCITDPDTGLVLLLLKEKKRERKTSSKSSVRKRRVVIVDPETGKEMTVYEAYRKGLIDHQTYLELAEQECEWEEITMTSSDGTVKSIIIDRRSGRQYDVDDALSRGLIDQKALDTYRSGNLAITEFADMLSGNVGGIRSRSSSFGSTTGSTYSSPMSPIPSIKAPAVIWNDPAEEICPIAGILDIDTLEKVSITEAIHRNLVDNITGQRLLEAQACTGGIIDPVTGERFTVADATEKGLVDKIMVDRLNLAQKAFKGFEDPRTKEKMSASQALKKGWLYYEAGQRFLEVQYLTGGLIEPDVEGRVSLDESIRKGTIDARTAQKLRDAGAYSKYLTCPKTKLKISFKDAMDKSMVEEGTSLRLLEASSQSSKGLYSPYNASGPGSAYGSRSGSRTGSRSGSRRGSIDAGFSMSFSSSSYTSSSTGYGRRF
ncbi:plectin-like isoform X5 [Epinephelus moara]|uniref:plectin-like isoform X5 n=1 Tax=Epinephelus moara TaxID=300413 RepID=UPI00214E7BA1|nr:plectin-like isoform X5 [Epinephelus moara]